jgi:hypothetical protein
MTHFVTLTVPPPRTDHSLRHSTTRVGLQARRFRILWNHEKRHDFRHPGQLFRNLPVFTKSLYMTSYEVSIGFWAIGYTFHAFYGPFYCLSSRELLSIIPEDRMTHFVTLTVPPPRTDHSLRHTTTRVGLRATWFWILWFHKKRPFRAIYVSYSTWFSAPGSTFSKPPRFLPNPCRWHLMRFPIVFRAIGYTFHAFYGTFRCLSSCE